VSITKQQLENLYVGQGLSYRQCAASLGLPTSGGVQWLMKKFSIPARPQLQVDKFNGGAKPREKHKVTIHCTHCGGKLERYPSLIQEHNFCNFTCKAEWQRRDLTGQHFGMLTVVESAGRDRYQHLLWKCLCECGGEKAVRTSDLLGGGVKSCGCQLRRTGKDHHAWKGGKIEVRCANPACNKILRRREYQIRLYRDSFCNAKCMAAVHLAGKTGELNARYVERVEVPCAYCGKNLKKTPNYTRLYARSFCNVACQGKWISENKAGSNNANWRGGKSFEPYPVTWNFRLREAIRNRDGRTCQICGKLEGKERMAVHHIDYDKKNIVPGNLVALCHTCHCKTNSNRERWREFFSLLMEFPGNQQIAV